MDTFEDIGSLYCEYMKNNKDDNMTELQFFKYALKDAINEMDTLRQQYHTLDKQLKNIKAESNYYAEDVIHLQTENKALAEEIVTLKVQEKAYKEKYESLKKILATVEVKDKPTIIDYQENKSEQQTVHDLSSSSNISNYVKKDHLQPLETKISFIEKLVCSKMKNLSVEDEPSSFKIVNSLKINDNCTEWSCPKHSKFLDILKGIQISEQTVEDQYLIRKAKARFVYWEDKKNKNTPRCPTQDRKKGQVVHYQQPKCWP
ncbi:Uncharacterized protein FWK35_00032385 [Aphis craccivora]|uniref:Uncharacterized protein n=1 Tax=Aphis craccivora TaxID=307492 RepID=A0A6G0W5F9_APHCR|nr:Uncharacterized protein FWK35_00032385 [Aphis craccivora]